MSDLIISQVGAAIKWTIRLMNRTTGAAITGKTKASFTFNLSKNGVGNVSTTNITLTEVDATNNAGEYIVTVPATDFVAASGVYELYVGYTADLSYFFELKATVTPSVVPAVPLGEASFTAASGNGRITDGTNPVVGAVVYVVDPSGKAYTSAITDANGLIGTLYFTVAGTYTAYAMKAGYAQTSFSIVVSGTTTTGPLTDAALTATASTSGMTLAELRAYGRMMVHDQVGTEADTKINGAVNDALGMLAKSRLWSWLWTDWDLNVHAQYNTGIITITSGTTGAVVSTMSVSLPTWVDSNCKILIKGKWLRIASRTNTTTLVLTDTWPEATYAGGYTIVKDEYVLPTDCLKFGMPFSGIDWLWKTEPVSFEEIRAMQIVTRTPLNFPGVHAIHNNKIILCPWPAVDAYYPCIYFKAPSLLVSDSDAADWDPQHLEVLQRGIDYQLCLRFGATVLGDVKTCFAAYKEAFNRACANEKDSPQFRQPMNQGRTVRTQFSYPTNT
jgi:hypothetical protein